MASSTPSERSELEKKSDNTALARCAPDICNGTHPRCFHSLHCNVIRRLKTTRNARGTWDSLRKQRLDRFQMHTLKLLG